MHIKKKRWNGMINFIVSTTIVNSQELRSRVVTSDEAVREYRMEFIELYKT